MARRSASRLRRFASFTLVVFGLFLLTEQVAHHDLACHLKTPQHCNACASSSPGSDPHPPAAPGANVLADAGDAVRTPVLLCGTVLPARSAGRSPPAAL